MGKAQRHKGAAARNRMKKNKKKALKPIPPKAASDGSAASGALTYLEQWSLQRQLPASEAAVWKFNKTRQSFLLRAWPHREKLSSDAFKLWLAYAQSLPAACAEKTVAHAREVVTSSEAAEEELARQQEAEQQQASSAGGGDGDDGADPPSAAPGMTPEEREERRAVLKIQRVRALKLIKALVEPSTSGE